MVRNKNNKNSSEVGMILEQIDGKIDLIAEQFLDIKKDINVLKDDVGMVREDVETIKIDIEFIKHDLKNKVSRDEFFALEKRVALLESRR